MKSSEILNAPSAEDRTPGEYRFELWLRQRRGNGLLLLLGVVFLLFGLDGILAYAVVLSGTAWMSTRAADHANLPGLREVLQRHPKQYVFYSDRFEADGLHGGRLVRNFLTTTADLTTDWSTKSFWFGTQADWITKSFWFSTNDQGFPPVAEGMLHYDVPKPVGTFRVMVLGGSTVEGWGVNSPLESFPAKLQALLAAALAEHPAEGVQRVEVINAGVSNYASDDEYLYLLADLLPFQPDLVIAYDGWNDAEMLSTWFSGDRGTRPYRAGPKQENGARVNASFTPGGAIAFAAAITSQRALALLDGFFTFRVLHGLFKKTIPFDKVKVPYQPAFSQRAAQFYIENRERMLFLAKQNGFRLASILQPVIGVDGKEYAAIERAYYAEIDPGRPNMRHAREVFYATVRPLLQSFKAAHEEEGVCVADISDTVFKGHVEPLYADDGHLLPVGNQIVAKRVLAELRRCNVVPF